MASQCSELVGCAFQWQAAQRCQFGGDSLAKPRRRIQPGTHRRAALGQLADGGEGGVNCLFRQFELGDERRQLLAEGDGRGVHHVSTTGLYQTVMAGCLIGQGLAQLANRRQQVAFDGADGGNVHGRREAVVGALCTVDMVIGVHRALAATRVARELVGPPGNHFVDVHVALRTATGLPDHQRELLVVLTGDHFVGSLLDQPGDIRGQVTDAVVDACGGFLDQRQGVHHGNGHALLADGEIHPRTLGLRAPVRVFRYVDWADTVGFGAAHE